MFPVCQAARTELCMRLHCCPLALCHPDASAVGRGAPLISSRKPRPRGLSSSPRTWGSNPGFGLRSAPSATVRTWPLCSVETEEILSTMLSCLGPARPRLAAGLGTSPLSSLAFHRRCVGRDSDSRDRSVAHLLSDAFVFQESSGLGSGGVGLQDKLVARLSLQLLLGQERLEGG